MTVRPFHFQAERGASGFRHQRSSPLPLVDPEVVRRACWAAATRFRGTVSVAVQTSPATFSCTALHSLDGRLTTVAVAHLYLPLVVLADVPPGPGGTLRALAPVPAWADGFAAFNLTVLDDATLRIPLANVDPAPAENLICPGGSRCGEVRESRARTFESVLSRGWYWPRHDGRSCYCDLLTRP